jgi:hypothetical protein
MSAVNKVTRPTSVLKDKEPAAEAEVEEEKVAVDAAMAVEDAAEAEMADLAATAIIVVNRVTGQLHAGKSPRMRICARPAIQLQVERQETPTLTGVD